MLLVAGNTHDVDLRAAATATKLSELNPYTTIAVSEDPLAVGEDLSFLKQYQVMTWSMSAVLTVDQCVILTCAHLSLQMTVDRICRENNISLVVADVAGVFCSMFVDCGENFEVDRTGHCHIC